MSPPSMSTDLDCRPSADHNCRPGGEAGTTCVAPTGVSSGLVPPNSATASSSSGDTIKRSLICWRPISTTRRHPSNSPRRLSAMMWRMKKGPYPMLGKTQCSLFGQLLPRARRLSRCGDLGVEHFADHNGELLAGQRLLQELDAGI